MIRPIFSARRAGQAPVTGAAIAAALVGAALLSACSPEGDASALPPLSDFATGAIAALTIHETPQPAPTTAFAAETGETVRISDFKGQVVVLNFWATWCAPCLREMPSLDRLAAAMADEDVEVVLVSVDRGGIEAQPRRTYDQLGLANLDLYREPSMAIMREINASGLPTTVIYDRQGREVARLAGEAEWDAPDVQALLRRLLDEAG